MVILNLEEFRGVIMRVGIVGAGSIGNHFAHSFSKASWDVDVYDVDDNALVRMRDEIYPSRYGAISPKIALWNNKEDFLKMKFDLVVIGTPPDTHTTVFIELVKVVECPIMIEKPACTPNLDDLEHLETQIQNYKNKVFIGFNHRVARSTLIVQNLITANSLGVPSSVEVNWDESWEGILKAHPWLNSPQDSYLGFTSRGGGALFEHSHGIDLALYFSGVTDLETITKFSSRPVKVGEGASFYDESIAVELELKDSRFIKVHQDVITFPAHKEIRLNFSNAQISLQFGKVPNTDVIHAVIDASAAVSCDISVQKSRPDDFDQEVRSLEQYLLGNIRYEDHPLRASLGLITAAVSISALNGG